MKKLFLVALLLVPMTMMAQKFGQVNRQDIVKIMPEYTKANTELEALGKQYEADLKNMQDELQKKSDAYDKEKATLPENIKQRREQEMQEMAQRMQQSYQDNQQAMQKAQSDKMAPILTKLNDAINAVGQAGGYVFIVDAGSMAYISTSQCTDVTSQVKAKLGLK